jgi:hypothetical protein
MNKCAICQEKDGDSPNHRMPVRALRRRVFL